MAAVISYIFSSVSRIVKFDPRRLAWLRCSNSMQHFTSKIFLQNTKSKKSTTKPTKKRFVMVSIFQSKPKPPPTPNIP